MSGREWKPGDVAMSRYGRVFYGGNESRGSWTFDDGSGGFGPRLQPLQTQEPKDLRPLVVIDAEDECHVDDLQAALIRSGAQIQWDVLQDALREFTNPTPPKPAEPTGLGAVVEDADGERWVRGADVELGGGVWLRELVRGGGSPLSKQYAVISAVRVLSEGVTL